MREWRGWFHKAYLDPDVPPSSILSRGDEKKRQGYLKFFLSYIAGLLGVAWRSGGRTYLCKWSCEGMESHSTSRPNFMRIRTTRDVPWWATRTVNCGIILYLNCLHTDLIFWTSHFNSTGPNLRNHPGIVVYLGTDVCTSIREASYQKRKQKRQRRLPAMTSSTLGPPQLYIYLEEPLSIVLCTHLHTYIQGEQRWSSLDRLNLGVSIMRECTLDLPIRRRLCTTKYKGVWGIGEKDSPP